jgi:catechol 2,3-dioxygenase-like lactoylglutathione lyase family enzyme
MGDSSTRGDHMNRISRRELLLSVPALVPALALGPRIFAAQAGKPAVQVKTINHFALAVSDVKKSVDFYQGLFGMPIQQREGSTVILRIGSGPQYMALMPAGTNMPSIVGNFGMGIDNFNADQVINILAQHGVTKAEASDPGLSGGAMKVRVSKRGDTNELFLGDPDGMVVQLQDTKYCGGSGPMGNMCLATPEPAPKKGLIALKELSHFTIFGVANADRTQAFYQEAFGMPIRARQGPVGTGTGAPGLGVGPGVSFIMFAGGGGGAPRGGGAPAAPRPSNINHACMNMENFDKDEVTKTLASFGITPSATQTTGPLKTYVSMRMENRGGAKEGTPELYFTDPDGLLLQLQDVKYCGGAGVLGNVCTG